MEVLSHIIAFCKDVLLLSASQLFAMFGVFFFFGLLLFVFARLTRNTFVRSVGQSGDIYFTGWIGTPVHELGHALFCLLFGHKITAIKLFSPNVENGSLGYVNHSYNLKNPWHRIGHFFIGLGPILLGSFVLYVLLRLLVPDNDLLLMYVDAQAADFSSFGALIIAFKQLIPDALHMISLLFSSVNLHAWSFYLFLYLGLCIASHMELSPPDLKGLGSGLLYLFVLLLLVNSILILIGVNTDQMVNFAAKYTSITTGMLMFSTMLSALFFMLSFIVLNGYTIFRFRKVFHPFG